MFLYNVSVLWCYVVCQNGGIRLQGGSNTNEGRVEVCNENRWGSVCDDGWNAADAMVACRQLGLSPQGKTGFGAWVLPKPSSRNIVEMGASREYTTTS